MVSHAPSSVTVVVNTTGGRVTVNVEVIVVVSMMVVLETMSCVMVRGKQSVAVIVVGIQNVGVGPGVVGSESGGTGRVGVVPGVVGSKSGGTGRVGVISGAVMG